MATNRVRLQVLAAVIALIGLSGCPLFAPSPKLLVSTEALNFNAVQTFRILTLINDGGGTLTWSIEEVTRVDENSPWVSDEIPWLSANMTSGTTTAKNTQIELSANRAGLSPGIINNTGIRIISNGGEFIVPISLVVQTTLFTNTSSISLNPDDFSLTFQILNQGSNTSNWQLFFIPVPGDISTATSFPNDFSINPGTTGSTAPNSSTTITLNWLLEQDNFDILVLSDAGQGIITVQFDAFIQNLEITPIPIVLFVSLSPNTVSQPVSKLNLKNVGAIAQSLTVIAVDLLDESANPPIAIAPASLTITSNTTEQIGVNATDIEILTGSGNYALEVRSGTETTRVPVIVEITELPVIAISESPDPEVGRPEVVPLSVLDFGTSSFQETFYVVNVGPPGSQLFFTVKEVLDEEGEVVEAPLPLILDISPNQGDTNAEEGDFFETGTNRFLDGQPVTVTIDRSALVEEVQFVTLEIASTNSNFSAENEAVEPVQILVRVEQPPLIVEGALNRSRPPYMGRWVLLVRDRFGNAVAAQTNEDFERIDFKIFEDGIALDLDETNKFVNKPRNLNIAIVLDYTASLLNAGTTNIQNPLDKGEATQNMIESTKELIRDLPPNTRIGLFYHHDRSQQNFVMHQFSTDKASLIDRLDTFKVPNALFGSTKVNDAVAVAISAVIAEDPADALPFDETDVRAVLYISDGEDNSSALNASDVIDLARAFQVRLFPVAYDPGATGPTTAELVEMSVETGGHFYNAGKDVLNLEKILSNAAGLTFTVAPPTSSADTIAFNINNPTEQVLSYLINFDTSVQWLSSVSPGSAQINPGSSRKITVSVNPNPLLVPANTTVETTLNVTSNLGKGKILLNMTTNGSGGVADLKLTLIDQPGKFWDDLQNQFMLTYNTPRQQDFEYNIEVLYQQPNGEFISGSFQEDSLFFVGDPLAGQITLLTTGINSENKVEVNVRADFVPRNVNRFRMRFYLQLPVNTPAAAAAAFANVITNVALATGENSLLVPEDPNAQSWNIIDEGDGVFLLLTEQDNPLPFSSFGDLLKITFTNMEPFIAAFDGIPQQPEFLLQMRVDNDIYFSPASPTQPSDTKYFLYPSGILNEERPLSIGTRPDLAGPSRTIAGLNQIIILNPEDPFAFDIDADGIRDFNDPFPFNQDLPSAIAGPALLDLVVPNPVDNAGPFSTPDDPLSIQPNEILPGLTIRNNRLDTFSWEIDPSTIPAWLSLDVTSGTLAPGQVQPIDLTVSNAGLSSNIFTDELLVTYDFQQFEDEIVALSLTVLSPEN